MDIGQLNRLLENQSSAKTKPGCDEIASYYVAIYDKNRPSLTTDDIYKALDFSLKAARIIPHSSGTIELVPVFTEWSRIFLNDLLLSDPSVSMPYLASVSFRINTYEAIAARKMSSVARWKQLLDTNYSIYSSYPESCENIHTLFLGLSIWHSEHGNPKEGEFFSRLAFTHSPDKKQKNNSLKILFFNLYQSGKYCEADTVLNKLIENKDLQSITDIVWYVSCHGIYNELSKTYHACVSTLLNASNSSTPNELKLLSLQLSEMLNSEQDHERITGFAQRYFEVFRLNQQKFSIPDLLSRLWNKQYHLFDKIVMFSIKNGYLDLLLQTLSNAFFVYGITQKETIYNEKCIPRFNMYSYQTSIWPVPDKSRHLVIYSFSDKFLFLYLFSPDTPRYAIHHDPGNSIQALKEVFRENTGSIQEFLVKSFSDFFFNEISSDSFYVSINKDLSTIPWTSLAIHSSKKIVLRPVVLPSHETPTTLDRKITIIAPQDVNLDYAKDEFSSINKYFNNVDVGCSSIAKNNIILSLESSRFFHYIGHGFGGHSANGGLLLAGVPGQPDCEILTFADIRKLNLSGMRLAFLNSCNSADSIKYAGNIGTDVASAFLDAGTQYVIATIRDIDDFMSAEFARIFYMHFKNQDSIVESFYTAAREIPESSKYYVLLTSVNN